MTETITVWTPDNGVGWATAWAALTTAGAEAEAEWVSPAGVHTIAPRDLVTCVDDKWVGVRGRWIGKLSEPRATLISLGVYMPEPEWVADEISLLEARTWALLADGRWGVVDGLARSDVEQLAKAGATRHPAIIAAEKRGEQRGEQRVLDAVAEKYNNPTSTA